MADDEYEPWGPISKEFDRRLLEARKAEPVTAEFTWEDEEMLRGGLLLLRRMLQDLDCQRVERAISGPIGKVFEARREQPATAAILAERRQVMEARGMLRLEEE